jgi:transcriptional regulator with XRE-family HTH domain
MKSIREMIRCIRRVFPSLSEEGIGRKVGVKQSTINRWYNGESNPTTDHLTAITELYRAARQALADASLVHSDFQYVCSFAPRYTHHLASDAELALAQILRDFKWSPTVVARQCLHIDFYIRAAPLSDKIRAHTFQEATEDPKVFIVLVNQGLSDSEQVRVAWDEAFAHVIRRFITDSTPVNHPRPVIK